MATSNFTLNNIHAHTKPAETEPKTPSRNKNSAQNTNRKTKLLHWKKFLHVILALLSSENTVTNLILGVGISLQNVAEPTRSQAPNAASADEA